jgi:PPOX class probable F420-dependent enzyme
MIDWTTPLARRVKRRLKSDLVVWLTTIGPDGTPQPRPVWFYWDSAEPGQLLIYSQPTGYKLKHLARNPRVALHFNTDEQGNEVEVLLGQARADPDHPPADKHAAYLRKHRQAIRDIDMTPRSFAESFSVPLRVRLESLRGS